MKNSIARVFFTHIFTKRKATISGLSAPIFILSFCMSACAPATMSPKDRNEFIGADILLVSTQVTPKINTAISNMSNINPVLMNGGAIGGAIGAMATEMVIANEEKENSHTLDPVEKTFQANKVNENFASAIAEKIRAIKEIKINDIKIITDAKSNKEKSKMINRRPRSLIVIDVTHAFVPSLNVLDVQSKITFYRHIGMDPVFVINAISQSATFGEPKILTRTKNVPKTPEYAAQEIAAITERFQHEIENNPEQSDIFIKRRNREIALSKQSTTMVFTLKNDPISDLIKSDQFKNIIDDQVIASADVVQAALEDEIYGLSEKKAQKVKFLQSKDPLAPSLNGYSFNKFSSQTRTVFKRNAGNIISFPKANEGIIFGGYDR